MEFLEKIITYLEHIDQKKLLQQLGIFLGITTVLAGCGIYMIHSRRNASIEQLESIKKLSKKVVSLVQKSNKMKREEERIKELLQKNKNFSIKNYFEQFCRTHSITPEKGWDTENRSIEGNDTFDEIILPATFKNQTTENLVTILNALDRNEIVYIRELDIKNTGKTISFILTIATKKQKHFWDD